MTYLTAITKAVAGFAVPYGIWAAISVYQLYASGAV